MRVVLLRTNNCKTDPRVEKEAESLCKLSGILLRIVCWDRDSKYKIREEKLKLINHEVPIVRFGIPATWGGGMKANFFPMLAFEWKLFWWLMLHHRQYDTIHACDLLTGLPAFLPRKLFHKKLVYDIFDYYADTQHGPKGILKLFRKLENSVINSADVTILCSETRQEQIAGTRPRRLVVLHNAPSSDQILQSGANRNFSLQGDPQRTKIVYVGNLVEDRFIMKALSCAEKLPEAEFHIGGYGILEEPIRQLAQTQDNIYFYGKLAYKDVLALERQCDIMLALYDPAVPNHAYAAPNKFYEALALGKPLIMFRNTGMDGVIEQQGIGAVCQASEAGLLEAFQTLIARKPEWDQMRSTMLELFHTSYSWDIMEKRLCNIYTELSAGEDKL